MTETPRSRRPALLTRESWSRRLSEAWQARARSYRERSLTWRVLTPAVFLLAGALFVTSSVASDGTDLRAGRYGDLSTVVQQATKEVDELQAERAALADEVERLTAELNDTGVSPIQEKVRRLEVPAGMGAMKGPGLTVELDDAPNDTSADPDVDQNFLVVHQQDIQAVVNALWAGGAEAMTIQGQRVISTTGIKCVGNTVVLHGIPYSPPYVITAVGDPASMLTALNDSPYVASYLTWVERHDLGWDVLPHSEVELPPYKGTLDLDYARPAGESDDRADDDV
ncbi:MAG TPA: DUF881 domain-containing protein [Nocardioidaceae bacterium]|nr:DUF881 domain-containing protein [Nocardioidaceae bacterium]